MVPRFSTNSSWFHAHARVDERHGLAVSSVLMEMAQRSFRLEHRLAGKFGGTGVFPHASAALLISSRTKIPDPCIEGMDHNVQQLLDFA